ncbi:cytochrome c oxidase subunit 3 [Desulfobaculum xiamenense]|uniref:Cytochrome c oxidase subunit 3 n=1 Tax=Desulfobaculum xiamenense TaxID=995050 RepID=A0A846QRL7_9BACT|nr:cytochrome c oxidase subunit 3 family protein [Desulfobaculum xiamenense]NJB67834.1 cytochrome c oxidase subunit 3 [Desulfobaculum xiamenense]
MTHEVQPDYIGAKMGMWLFLFTEILLFGGLFVLFAVHLSRYPAGFHAGSATLSVPFGSANTVVLITSSLTMALAVTAVQRGERRRTLALLGATVGLAGVFLINKFFEWSAKFQHGIYPGSEHMLEMEKGQAAFYAMYYAMTGLHGLHVVIGMCVIAWVMGLVAAGRVHRDRFVTLENAGLYWHLVDLVWIYLFPLFYLVT